MSVLTYARKILDKLCPKPVPDEQDLVRRFYHFTKLSESSAKVWQTIKTPGWLIIEQVLTDTIDANKEFLTHNNFQKLEEVAKVQGNIESLEQFLLTVDSIDTTFNNARKETETLEKALRLEKGKD